MLAVLMCHLVMILGGSIILGLGGWTDELPIEATFFALMPFWLSTGAAAVLLARRDDVSVVWALRLDARWYDPIVGVAVGAGAQLVIPYVYGPILDLFNADLDSLEKPARELADSATGSLGTFLLIIMTVVCAPIAEEVLYRGIVLRGLQNFGSAGSIVLSGVLFGAIHLQPLQFFGLALFGMLLAAMVVKTGRIAPAVFAHMAFNAVSVAYLLA